MNATALVEAVRQAGGVLTLDGDGIDYQLSPETAGWLVPLLRECKPELVELLRKKGGRIANFPRCPECRSYALYRKNNIGTSECQSCGLSGIDEAMARRTA